MIFRQILLVLILHSAVFAHADTMASGDINLALVNAAKSRTLQSVRYNGAYFNIGYPGGDVPQHLGVCTDVVIRSYRQVGIDLQKNVHEDMVENFKQYPSRRIWGLDKPDANIDHRRVPNLQAFFTRHGKSLSVSNKPGDYLPGDLVTWMLPGNLPHIGIVIDQFAANAPIPLIAHNIGAGPKIDNVLFQYPITGHYRYSGR